AQAVRHSLAVEFSGVTAPARRGPGRPRKNAATAGVTNGRRGPRKGSRRRPITDAELNVVLGLLAKKPNLTSAQIQEEPRIDSQEAARVLNKLRETRKVHWKGERSRATYTVAA